MARDRLKERLTGALALLVLGVVAWFWLLNTEEATAPVAEETAIPPVPVIEPFPVPQPEIPPELTTPPPPAIAGRREPTSVAQDTAPRAPSAQEPPAPAAEPPAAEKAPVENGGPPAVPPAGEFALDELGLPVAWVVQVASLSTPANAKRLVEQLKAAGYKGYSREVTAGNEKVHRVYVGPKLSREGADAQRDAVAARFGLTPLVVRFEP